MSGNRTYTVTYTRSTFQKCNSQYINRLRADERYLKSQTTGYLAVTNGNLYGMVP